MFPYIYIQLEGEEQFNKSVLILTAFGYTINTEYVIRAYFSSYKYIFLYTYQEKILFFLLTNHPDRVKETFKTVKIKPLEYTKLLEY